MMATLETRAENTDTVELDGFSMRLLLNLVFARWNDLSGLLDWLAAQEATPVYVLQRFSGEQPEATIHIENLPSWRLREWLDTARQAGAVRSARIEHLLVRI